MFHQIYKLPFISKTSQVYLTFFSMMLKSMSFSPTVPEARPQTWGKIFLCSHLSFTAAHSLKSEKIGLLILLNCEATSLTVFTTMCSKEQQTSDNLIVKKFSFSGILRSCSSHLNEAWKE